MTNIYNSWKAKGKKVTEKKTLHIGFTYKGIVFNGEKQGKEILGLLLEYDQESGLASLRDSKGEILTVNLKSLQIITAV